MTDIIKELIESLEDMDTDPIYTEYVELGKPRKYVTNPFSINRKLGIISRLFKEVTKESKDMEYKSTGRTYAEEITRLSDIIYEWHSTHTTLLLSLKQLIKDIPYNYTHETTFVEYQRIFVANEYSEWEDRLKELVKDE